MKQLTISSTKTDKSITVRIHRGGGHTKLFLSGVCVNQSNWRSVKSICDYIDAAGMGRCLIQSGDHKMMWSNCAFHAALGAFLSKC